jgi:hypothetical protein
VEVGRAIEREHLLPSAEEGFDLAVISFGFGNSLLEKSKEGCNKLEA